MSTTNFSSSRSHTKSFEELLCFPSLMGGLQQQLSICFLAVDILLSITAFSGNSPILVALHKKILPPSAVQAPVSFSGNHWSVGWSCCSASKFSMLDVRGSRQWSLCRYARDADYVTSYVLILVSLMTMTAISVDRLLALLLGLRYKQIVTLKRTYIIVTTFWVFTLVASLCAIFYLLIIFQYSSLVILFCLVISFASYTNIFCTLRYH